MGQAVGQFTIEPPDKKGAFTIEAPPPSRTSQLVDQFINHPMFPRMAELATAAGEVEQQDLYRSLGPEAGKRSLTSRILNYGDSLAAGAARTFYGMAGMSPADMAVIAGSMATGQPEIGGAWFAAKGATQAPGAYKEAYKNPTPENVEGAIGATTAIVGGLTTAGSGRPSATLSKIGELRKSMKERVQPFARKVTGVESAVKESVEKTADKYVEDIAKHKADTVGTIKENLRKQREARTEIDQNKLKIAEENKGIEAKNAEQRAAVAKRGETAKTVDEQSIALGKSLEQVESKVYKAADKKFNAVRAQVGNPEAPPDALVTAVKNVESNVLQGIPENIKEFRSILNMAGEGEGPLSIGGAEIEPGEPGYEKVKQAYITEGLLKEGEPLTWDKLQSLKSRIDARLRRRGAINGDLKRGLFDVRNSIVEEMGKMAEANGAGELWTDAKNFWRQMREDFHEPTGPSGSGSPVAQALEAVDPKNIRQPFLTKQSTLGNRAIDTLRKYPEYGGMEAAAQAEALLKSHETMSGLPKKETPADFKKNPEAVRLPTDKPIPSKPETPTVDVHEVALKQIEKSAKNWKTWSQWDARRIASSALGSTIGALMGHTALGGGLGYTAGTLVPKYIGSLLDRANVAEWLARTPPEEAAILGKIPGADKIKVVDGLTNIAVAQAKSGKPVTVSPAARQLIGPANVARIVAAAGAIAGNQPVKNRKEALDALNPATP